MDGTEPRRFSALWRDAQDRPVPACVLVTMDGADYTKEKPGFREQARKHDLCWTCGQVLGRNKAFIVPSVCVVTGVTSEMPSHRDCAEWTATHPFGDAVLSPDVVAVVVSRRIRWFKANKGRAELLDMGALESATWFIEGRPASRTECAAAMTKVLPELNQIAETKDGMKGVHDLLTRIQRAANLMPPLTEAERAAMEVQVAQAVEEAPPGLVEAAQAALEEVS